VVRVGVLCESLVLGGQETGMLEVLRGLDRSRFHPFLYARRGGALLGEALGLGIPVVVEDEPPGMPRRAQTDRSGQPAGPAGLADRLRRDRIDVGLVYAWPDGMLAAREAGLGAIVERVDGPTSVRRIRDKSASTRIICESRAIRELLLAQHTLLRCDPGRVDVIPNAVDTARFDPARYDRARCRAELGVETGGFCVGAVCRLAFEKNISHLLEAGREFVTAEGDAVPVTIVLAGPDGGWRPALEAQARTLGLTERVRFLGPRSDIAALLRAFDVYVTTSFYEGTSFAVQEAMAMGLPIVATQIGSLAEVIRGNGYLVDAFNPAETCAVLRELAHDPVLRGRLGRRSRVLAWRRPLARMVQRYEDVLARALEEAATASSGPAPRSRPGSPASGRRPGTRSTAPA
jgi:glycosyltransferase involved in cell wall biosynthesis